MIIFIKVTSLIISGINYRLSPQNTTSMAYRRSFVSKIDNILMFFRTLSNSYYVIGSYLKSF